MRRPGGQTGTCGRAYDLDAMAAHCKDYQQLSLYWLERHPARVLDFSHESLLRETAPQVRRLLDFCGLDFDPACLSPHRTQREVYSTASAAQVRQPCERTPRGLGITRHSWRRCAAASSPEEAESVCPLRQPDSPYPKPHGCEVRSDMGGFNRLPFR
ncbi:MAG TPA: sulfotransferase [Rhodanobacter sp.]|nr:sulfotransferase [Rhodanobacter sp.]